MMFYEVCHLMTFVAYDICRLMTFVALLGFLHYDVCHLMTFVALWRLLPYCVGRLWCLNSLSLMKVMMFVAVPMYSILRSAMCHTVLCTVQYCAMFSTVQCSVLCNMQYCSVHMCSTVLCAHVPYCAVLSLLCCAYVHCAVLFCVHMCSTVLCAHVQYCGVCTCVLLWCVQYCSVCAILWCVHMCITVVCAVLCCALSRWLWATISREGEGGTEDHTHPLVRLHPLDTPTVNMTMNRQKISRQTDKGRQTDAHRSRQT